MKMWGGEYWGLRDEGWVIKCRAYGKALQKPATFLTNLNIQAQSSVQ